MIDGPVPDRRDDRPNPEPLPEHPSDLFSDLFEGGGPERSQSEKRVGPVAEAPTAGTAPPRAPRNLAETGLTVMQLGDLLLKQMHLQGHLLGVELARLVRLPFPVVDEALRFLKDEKCIEVASGELIGSASYRFLLTELGRRRAREAFEHCRYVGPAPVPLDDYIERCRLQTVAGTECTPDALHEAFGDMIVRDDLVEELGPAVCSGKSIFLHGPPGNGKTLVAKGLGRFLNRFGGDCWVPYAVDAENAVITVFDPTIHRPTDNAERQPFAAAEETGSVQNTIWEDDIPDGRWRRVRRPVVITGGELTLDMLDLRYHQGGNFYTAPLHIKANGGVFLIDDFGRQIVSPRDLLNRWILPLEEGVDFLTLATGKKFSVPFEQLIVFSTNLDPRELVDEAFLRRIRHKIRIGPPARDLFTEIFRLGCRQRNIEFSEAAVDFLYTRFYDRGKSPRSSDPRDLLEIAQSICRFRNQDVLLTPELMAEATQRFFCQI